jgi:hypothetical protein
MAAVFGLELKARQDMPYLKIEKVSLSNPIRGAIAMRYLWLLYISPVRVSSCWFSFEN